MNKYLIASHGQLAAGALSSLSILIGSLPNVYTLEAFLDSSSLESKVEEAFDKLGTFDQLIIFADLHGGSVAQHLFLKMKADPRNIKVIAGFNLALLLELVIQEEVVSDEALRMAISNSKEMTLLLNDAVSPKSDSFF